MTSSRLAAVFWSVVLLVGGRLVLGDDWHGHQTTPGVWRDGVLLRTWGLWWAILCVLGGLAARRLASRGSRGMALVPLIGWYGWMLRDSALGPVAWTFYAAVTSAAWLVGAELGALVPRRGTARDALN